MASRPRAAPKLVKLALPPPWAAIGLSRRDERTSFDAVGVRRQVPSMILCPLQRLLTVGLTSPSVMTPGRRAALSRNGYEIFNQDSAFHDHARSIFGITNGSRYSREMNRLASLLKGPVKRSVSGSNSSMGPSMIGS